MLNEREKQICGRLRQFRELHQIPRTKFALNVVGISGERLASYEAGRARVPYGVARSLALTFHLNESWLAEGIGEILLTLDTGPDRPETIPEGKPFTEVYDAILRPLLEERSKILKSADSLSGFVAPRKGLGIYDKMRETLIRRMASEIQSAPGKFLPFYMKEWDALSHRAKQKHDNPPGGKVQG